MLFGAEQALIDSSCSFPEDVMFSGYSDWNCRTGLSKSQHWKIVLALWEHHNDSLKQSLSSESIEV